MLPVFPKPPTQVDEGPPGAVVRFDVYSHHVKVTRFGRPVKDALLSFCRTLAEFGLKKVRGRFVKAMTRIYVGVTRERDAFSFHINEMERLITHLGNYGISEKLIYKVYHDLHTPTPVTLNYIDPRTPRDYQSPIIEYIVADGKFKVVTLDPGRGKTFIALKAMYHIKERTFFCIKAMYIQKWIGDIQEAFDLKKGDLMVVKGTANMQALMNLAEAGELKAKIILCSNVTFQLYLKKYEYYGKEILNQGYPFLPHDFFSKLGVGIRVVDELHEHFHFNYRLDCYTHVPKVLGLTGTLFHDDAFIERMQEVAHPKEYRFNEEGRKVYIKVEGIKYSIPNVDQRVSYMNHAMKSYSHIRFEQSIMKRKKMTRAYLGMVADIVDKRFAEVRQQGQKMVIYFATVDFCTVAHETLSQLHPELVVKRFVADDDYEEMLEGDIIVSTLKSLGTAIDVPGLRMALLTDAVSSQQANIQCMGRLRPLKDWPDTSPEFFFLVCKNIEKHLSYAEKKDKDFKGRVLEMKYTDSGYEI